MQTRIGISGWRYEPWKGVFYPKSLTENKHLWFASRKVNSIEINGTFYATQTPESFKKWYRMTPEDFMFSVKAPRFITHIKRLKDCKGPLGNFFGSGLLHLREKLGPILWQLPPRFLFREEEIEPFLKSLPRNFKEGIHAAKKADRLMADYPNDKNLLKIPIRHALEVRNYSFLNPDFVAMLRRNDIALVFADTAGKWPYIEDITSDFIYIRLHGEKEIYKSGYGENSLKWWAQRIRAWQRGYYVADQLAISTVMPKKSHRDVFVYFDNDIKVRAPHDAMRLAEMLKVDWDFLARAS
jgi:uncharacterized protein YecE (DUF72 family)